jgi:hypothetical protein
LALEHGELLAESEDFQGGIGSRREEYREYTPHSDEELDHEILVVTSARPDRSAYWGSF